MFNVLDMLLFHFQTESYYLRALGDNPRKDIADLETQFPKLAEDITLPYFYPREKFFSSVFRIASKGTQLWTHYDVNTITKTPWLLNEYNPYASHISAFWVEILLFQKLILTRLDSITIKANY